MINKDNQYKKAVNYIASQLIGVFGVEYDQLKPLCDMAAHLHHQPDRVGDDYSSNGDDVWFDVIERAAEMWISWENTDGRDFVGEPPAPIAHKVSYLRDPHDGIN